MSSLEWISWRMLVDACSSHPRLASRYRTPRRNKSSKGLSWLLSRRRDQQRHRYFECCLKFAGMPDRNAAAEAQETACRRRRPNPTYQKAERDLGPEPMRMIISGTWSIRPANSWGWRGARRVACMGLTVRSLFESLAYPMWSISGPTRHPSTTTRAAATNKQQI